MQTPTPTGPVSHGKFVVDGVIRTYRLLQPPTIQPGRPAPLLVALHPCPSTADESASPATDAWAAAEMFYLVLPDGDNGCWNAGSCCSGAADLAFISQLIDRLESQLHIDRARVFVAGLSNGAAMAYRVACELSTKISAIAVVSGALLVDTCQPSRPVSVLIMHGSNDDTYPIAGGGTYEIPPLSAVVERWVGLDGCTGAPKQTKSGITNISEWDSCQAGTVVRSEVITGAPHAWFGSEDNPLPGEPDATTTIGVFFSSLQPTH